MSQSNHHDAPERVEHRFRNLKVWFTVGSYTVLAPFGLVIFAFLCLVWRGDKTARARRLQRVTVIAYRFMHHWLRWTGITHFDHRWPVEGIPSEPCVVIANHPTLMDITSITAVMGAGCTIVKPAMYERRLLHPLLVGAGHIKGPGSDLISIGSVVEAASDRLARGFPLIVFPEGTRSREGKLLPFGRIAFEIACRAEVPIVSLTIECEPVYLSKEVPLFSPPWSTPQFKVGLLAVDDPATANNDSRELRRKIESRYQAWSDRAKTQDRAPTPRPTSKQ